MLSCKQVATIASDYLDNSTPLKWQIRLHLLMCANCRRFVRHLKITRQVSAQMATDKPVEDVDIIWKKVQQRVK
ncbi:zf-HC2 domain-containing protein [Cellvibrio sp.]|jgi:hypothetical protein